MKNIFNMSIFSLILIVLLLSQTVSAFASPATIDLGTAGNYVVLAKTGITTTTGSSIVGDIGVSPIDSTAITGFDLILDPSGTFSTSAVVNGNIYAADYTEPTPTNLGTAIGDMQTAYTDAAGRPTPDATELYSGDLGGQTLAPGLYKWGTGVIIPTDLTLDCSGNTNAVFIFQIAGDLELASDKQVILINNCQAKNIFWQVGGSTGAILNTGSNFNGIILSAKQVNIYTGATLNGRALAETQVTLQSNPIIEPDDITDDTPPEVTLDTQDNFWTNNNQTGLNFTFTDTNSPTANCNLFIDGILYNESLLTNENVVTLITPNATLTEGTHDWYVNCTDPSGNKGTSDSRVLNIDTIVPVINLVNPINNTWGTGIFTFNYTDASTSTCTLYIDDIATGTNDSVINNTDTNITTNISITQGSHNWSINCTDQANNTGNSNTWIVLIDSIYPEAIINNINNVNNGEVTTNTTLTINYTVNDTNIKNWTLVIYDSTWSTLQTFNDTTNNISAIKIYTVASNGTYHANLTVEDNASNINITSFTIYVGTSTPIINSINSEDITQNRATIKVNVTDQYFAIDNCTYSNVGIGNLKLVNGIYTVNLTNLDSSTKYNVKVICYNIIGNSVNDTIEFTTLKRPSSGGGSYSGGGSSGSSTNTNVSVINTTEQLSENEINETVDILNETEESETLITKPIIQGYPEYTLHLDYPNTIIVNQTATITVFVQTNNGKQNIEGIRINIITPWDKIIQLQTNSKGHATFIPEYMGYYGIQIDGSKTIDGTMRVTVPNKYPSQNLEEINTTITPTKPPVTAGFFENWMVSANQNQNSLLLLGFGILLIILIATAIYSMTQKPKTTKSKKVQ